MTQHEDSCRGFCPTCRAAPGEECVTAEGRIAERVHWGRPGVADRTITRQSARLAKIEELIAEAKAKLPGGGR